MAAANNASERRSWKSSNMLVREPTSGLSMPTRDSYNDYASIYENDWQMQLLFARLEFSRVGRVCDFPEERCPWAR